MDSDFDIAIVGMAGRWPGARTLEEFWRHLADGVESIVGLSDEELRQAGVSETQLQDRHYVKAAATIDDPGVFDAAFFGISPLEARTIDPQHRLLLELAHEALEHAAYDPDRYQGRIGVYTGCAMNTYFTAAGLGDRFSAQYIPTLIASDKDFLSTRLSYKLNLTGPSLTVQSACSTSLVAVHLARQSLLSGETDIALAGAASVRVPHRVGYVCDRGGVVSPDGHVRAFDAAANGTVFGSGAGMVVLKRLADALGSGDTIHAVLKGSAVNNDGAAKAGYTAPSVHGQRDVVLEAIANAGVTADSISFVEAHGSGTPVGDPIEITALTSAFTASTDRRGYCAIGSVKANIGHLDAAAGMAGLIKTVLALEHRQIPPTLHFRQANPGIDFAQTPFYVNSTLEEWISDGPRRAGVMATGMGGTNAHVILEEAPARPSTIGEPASQLLVLSAKTGSALRQSTERLAGFLERHPQADLGDVAFTLQVGRKALAERRFVVCSDTTEAIAALREAPNPLTSTTAGADRRRPVIFMFPGIGDHYVGMAHGLYQTSPAFRTDVDRCAAILLPHLGVDIRQLLYPASASWTKTGTPAGIDLKQMLGRTADRPEDDPDTTALNATPFAQPALFTVEYAVARLWQSWGVTPDAMCGHSMGEYVAACLAGVMSLEDALRLIAVRARLVSTLPAGGMLTVLLPEAELRPMLPEALSIALINGPRLCVVAGPVDAVAALETRLTSAHVLTRPVRNGHAFHTRILQPIAAALDAEAATLSLRAPAIPYISNVSGTWITNQDATDPSYWSRHATQPARFDTAIRTLWQQKDAMLVDVGPGRTLSVIAMQHPDRATAGDPVAVASVRHQYEHGSDRDFLLDSVGKLWLAGLPIEWERMHPAGRRRTPLPTYPFEGRSHWLEGHTRRDRQPETAGIDHWFYAPTWERAGDVVRQPGPGPDSGPWLIVGDPQGDGSAIATALTTRGASAVLVRFGSKFERRADGSFVIDPECASDYRTLLQQLASASGLHIVYLGALPAAAAADDHDRSFYNLLYLAQAIGDLGVVTPITIGVVTRQLHDVTGDEVLHPAAAAVAGICGVMPKEFPNIKCFNVDLVHAAEPAQLTAVWNGVLSEFSTPPQGPIAHRGRYRWERRFRPIRLPAISTAGDVPPPLRPRGVYLITGGAGGIGLTIARYLASACQATLVLTKQTPLPDRADWATAIAAADTSPSLRSMLAGLLELEAAGAVVEVVVADVTDRQRMRDIRDQTIARHGAIHGVIHAAGTVRDGLMRLKTPHTVAAVLAPKVQGTVALFDVFKDDALDFVVLFSSMTSILAPRGVSEYSGANAFLDAFGAFANRRYRFRTVTINWPGWKEVGQLAHLPIAPALQGVKDGLLARAIHPSDGVEAFRRVLQSDLRHVLVSPQDLDELIEEPRLPFDSTPPLTTTQSIAAAPARSDSAAADRPPVTPTERALDEIWRQVLGTETPDIHASFFDLGGHSLLAITLMARIEERFGRRLPAATLLQAPTIAELASLIDPQVTTPPDAIAAGSLVRIKGGSRPPFFCVHGIGGEVLPFKPLASGLAPDQPFYGLQWDFDAAGPRFPSIETVAARYIQAIRRAVPRGPYLLGGYCSGAMIAWEMAQQLQTAGAAVGLVVLIDHALPAVDRLTLSTFISNLPYWITDDLMHASAAELKARARGKLNVALDWVSDALRRSTGPRRRSDIRDALGMWNAPERQIDWIEGHYRQYLAYQPRAYAGAVTIARARALPLFSPHRAPEVGWGKLATAGARVHCIPGNHATMLQAPWVGELAAHLQADLDDACARASADDFHREVAIAV